jgi:hypothetical protein
MSAGLTFGSISALFSTTDRLVEHALSAVLVIK